MTITASDTPRPLDPVVLLVTRIMHEYGLRNGDFLYREIKRELAASQRLVEDAKADIMRLHREADTLADEKVELKRRVEELEAAGEPVAWMTKESWQRLKRGGNASRGSVPVHAERSNVACIAVYAAPDDIRGQH